MKLKNKVAFITGGSRGIGAALVERFVAEGASVAFTFRNSKKAALALETKYRGKVLAIPLDVKNELSIRDAVENVSTHFGNLDILINNAGAFINKAASELTIDDYDHIMSTNVRGVFFSIVASLPLLNKGGRIINISSCIADRMPFMGGSLYAMSKSALTGMVKGFARDLGPMEITINNIQPGPINTEMNPGTGSLADELHSLMALKRHGKAEEVAGLAVYIASSESAFLTGTNLTIDGGMNA